MALQIRYFTHYMIAIVNNCSSIMELARQTRDRYWKPATNDHGVARALETLLSTYQASGHLPSVGTRLSNSSIVILGHAASHNCQSCLPPSTGAG